jgi:hypothetical protein
VKHKIILIILVILTAFYATTAYAAQKAERITDREIIERLTRLEEGQKSIEKRFDDLSKQVDSRFDDLNRRFDDLIKYIQILTGIMVAAFGGIIGWLMVIWKKLIKVEERQRSFETQDDEIKFLKEAVLRLLKS